MTDTVKKLIAAKEKDGDWLKSARRFLGFSQNDLAQRLRLTGGSRTVRKYELGERPVSGPVAVAVEAMLQGFQSEPVRGG